jgi:hypothetical protein
MNHIFNRIASSRSEHYMLGLDWMNWVEVIVEKQGECITELGVPTIRRW